MKREQSVTVENQLLSKEGQVNEKIMSTKGKKAVLYV